MTAHHPPIPRDTAAAAADSALAAPAPAARPWARRLGYLRSAASGLSARLVLCALGLLLLVQAAGFLVIRHSIDHTARTQLTEHLAQAQRVWLRLLDQRAARLSQAAAEIAADHGIGEAVAAGSFDTARAALVNRGPRLGATRDALLDSRFVVQALGEGADADLTAALAGLAPRLARQPGSSQVATVGGQPYQFVMVPMRAPAPAGWVVTGRPLDQALIDDLHAVAGVRAALVAQPAHGAAVVLANNLRQPADVRTLAGQLDDGDLPLGGEAYRVASWPVAADHDGRISLRLAGSIAEAMAPYRSLQWLLALITGLGIVLFGAGSLWAAARVTRPLRQLVGASERLGRGDCDQSVGELARPDEIGELARAMDGLRIRVAAQRQDIRQLAYRDRLTGLPNRLQFGELVRQAIAAADPARDHLAVLMLDLDRFKPVNEVLGHRSGDQLLQRVAERLQQLSRDGDVVARLDGDEFALLMRGADPATATEAANRIGAAFERPLLLDDQTVDLSMGLGIAAWPVHASDADTLLDRAEVAMSAAKRHTAGALVYDPALDLASAPNLSLLDELRHAVEHGELRLYLQPKIDIRTGAVCGAEALVRWQHPSRGLLPPVQFVPFAEQTGFVRQLTLWVFERAAAEQVALALLGVRRVSVNLSARDLLDQDLPDKLDTLLRRHRAVAEGFCLEITESAIMGDPQRAQATLNRLSARGYKLSIDDFGTGCSSLSCLERLPVDELKIDKRFVMAMEHNAGDARIVRSTIDLAHNLGLGVVAEGVESAAVLAQLHDLNCDEGQGFHMSQPLPAADFCDWVACWQARPPAPAGSPASLQRGAPLLH